MAQHTSERIWVFSSSEIPSKLGNARNATLTTASSWLDSPVSGRLSFAMATPARPSLVTDLNVRLLNFNFHPHSGPWLLPRIDVVRGSSDGNRPPLVLSSWFDGWLSELRWPGRIELFLAFAFPPRNVSLIEPLLNSNYHHETFLPKHARVFVVLK